MKLFYSIILFVTLTNLVNAQEEEPFWDYLCGPPVGEVLDIEITSQNDIYISAKNGLFYSSNEGKNWEQIIFNDWISDITITENDDIIFTSTWSLFYSTNNGTDWIESNSVWQNNDCSTADIISIKNRLYILGRCGEDPDNYYTVYYTENLSDNWGKHSFEQGRIVENQGNEEKYVIWNIDMGFNDEIILSGYYKSDVLPQNVGVIFILSADGENWERINIPSVVMDLQMISENEILVATGDTFLKTTDTGKTWEVLLNIGSKSVITLNENEILCGTLYEGVYYSSDKGLTWEKRSKGLHHEQITGFKQLENGTIYGKGITGFFVTTDKGLSWQQRNKGFTSANVYDIAFDSKGRLYAVDYGVYRSDDCGESWEYLGLQNFALSEILITKDDEIIVGSKRVYCGLYKSKDYGKTWYLSSEGLPRSSGVDDYKAIFDLMEGSDGTLYTAPDNVYYSTDKGETWNYPDVNPYGICYCIAENNEGHIFAGHTSCRVSRSTDNGRTWEQRTSSSHGTKNANYIFFHPDTLLGTMITRDAYYGLMTTNNGKSWLKKGVDYENTFLGGKDITIDQNNRIYYVGSKKVYRTTNKNPDNFFEYEDISSGLNHDLQCIEASPDGYIYIGSENGGIYRSRERYVSVEETPKQPNKIILEQNKPNPFEDETEISFVLPEECHVKLTISNTLGQILSVLADGNMTKGRHTLTYKTDKIQSGVYLYSHESCGKVITKQMQIIK